MKSSFMHVGKFEIAAENREAFVAVIKDYEKNVTQEGLDHAHLIHSQNEAGTYWYVTMWASREAWEKVEDLPEHKDMHTKRDPLVSRPVDQSFGDVIF